MQENVQKRAMDREGAEFNLACIAIKMISAAQDAEVQTKACKNNRACIQTGKNTICTRYQVNTGINTPLDHIIYISEAARVYKSLNSNQALIPTSHLLP